MGALIPSPSVQAPAAYVRANALRIAQRMALDASATMREAIATALQDDGYRYRIHPEETAGGLVAADLTFGFDPGDVRRYGATWDGETDDSAAINVSLGLTLPTLLPEGTANIDSGLVGVAGMVGKVIKGAGKDRTILQCYGAVIALDVRGTAIAQNHGWMLGGFTIESDGTSEEGIRGDYFYHGLLSDIKIVEAGSHGMRFERGFENTIIHPWIKDCGGNGIMFGRVANANNVYGGHLEYSALANACCTSEGDAQRAHGCSFFGTTMESGGVNQVNVEDTDENRFIGCYFESGGADTTVAQVHVGSAGDPAEGNVFHGCNFAGSFLNFHIEESIGTLVQGCAIRFGVTIESTATRARFFDNPIFSGTLTDNSTTTQLRNDPTAAWGFRIRNGTSEYRYRVNNDSTVFNFGTGYAAYDFTALAGAFRFEVVDAGGTPMAVLRFGAYRLWVSPTNGNLYKSGSTPTAHDNGTLIS